MDTRDTGHDGGRRQVTLLVVEDNLATRKLIVYWLAKHYGVFAAAHTEEALRLVRDHEVDGLILDINLFEELTGVDLLHAIRALACYRNVPAVACTAYTQTTDRQRLLSEGFDAYVAKPFTRDVLCEAVAGLFGAGARPGGAARRREEFTPGAALSARIRRVGFW